MPAIGSAIIWRLAGKAAPLCYTARMDEKPDNAAPRRRWYQFSLRTSLIGVMVMSLPCAYVGRHAKIVRERSAMIAELKGARVPGTADARFSWGEVTYAGSGEALHEIPWIRSILGDVSVRAIVLPVNTTQDYCDRSERLFPEALHFYWFREGDGPVKLGGRRNSTN